jgi:2'-5' RNA ligase
VLEICESFEYPKLELKNVSLFENDDYDVLKFEVNAKVLHEINDRLKKFPHTNNYPEYHPHCTIAYLKKGRGKKYVKMLEGTSIEVTPSKIVYSRPDGSVKYRKIKRNE